MLILHILFLKMLMSVQQSLSQSTQICDADYWKAQTATEHDDTNTGVKWFSFCKTVVYLLA